MGRIARVVAPGMPHHVTQRGNRRMQTFLREADYGVYLELMAAWCAAHQVTIWAYCLMPNHVHVVAVPQTIEGLGRAVGEAHRRYTRHINFREGWRGYLWQGRFASFVMDEDHLLRAMRYVELNPVRAGLVSAPDRWPWSSARPPDGPRRPTGEAADDRRIRGRLETLPGTRHFRGRVVAVPSAQPYGPPARQRYVHRLD